jgi:hypothetical protein
MSTTTNTKAMIERAGKRTEKRLLEHLKGIEEEMINHITCTLECSDKSFHEKNPQMKPYLDMEMKKVVDGLGRYSVFKLEKEDPKR